MHKLIKRVAVGGIAFFLIKGLVWLGIGIAAAVFATSKAEVGA